MNIYGDNTAHLYIYTNDMFFLFEYYLFLLGMWGPFSCVVLCVSDVKLLNTYSQQPWTTKQTVWYHEQTK